MQSHRFNTLKERLLKAGVAPRHVHRYIRELRDHYEDALQEELTRGMDRTAAEQAAGTRLGDERELENSVLARPELRSVIARFPLLAFGIAPLCIWVGTFALLSLLFFAMFSSANLGRPEPFLAGYALCIFIARVLPVLLGVAALILCARQRLPSRWPIIGIAIVAVVSGTLSVSMVLPTAGQTGQIGVDSSLLPFLFPNMEAAGMPDGAALVAGLARGLGMALISLAPYFLWRRQVGRSPASQL